MTTLATIQLLYNYQYFTKSNRILGVKGANAPFTPKIRTSLGFRDLLIITIGRSAGY
jgi:hypothetical protein